MDNTRIPSNTTTQTFTPTHGAADVRQKASPAPTKETETQAPALPPGELRAKEALPSNNVVSASALNYQAKIGEQITGDSTEKSILELPTSSHDYTLSVAGHSIANFKPLLGVKPTEEYAAQLNDVAKKKLQQGGIKNPTDEQIGLMGYELISRSSEDASFIRGSRDKVRDMVAPWHKTYDEKGNIKNQTLGNYKDIETVCQILEPDPPVVSVKSTGPDGKEINANVKVYGSLDQNEMKNIQTSVQKMYDAGLGQARNKNGEMVDVLKSVYIRDDIGGSPNPDDPSKSTFVVGLGGYGDQSIMIDRYATKELGNTQGNIWHESAHNANQIRKGAELKDPNTPFGRGTSVTDYGKTAPGEDYADTSVSLVNDLNGRNLDARTGIGDATIAEMTKDHEIPGQPGYDPALHAKYSEILNRVHNEYDQ